LKAAERQLRIRHKLESSDFLDLETLCREFRASESSLRRDLSKLEEQKFLRRVYGGAVHVEPVTKDNFDFRAAAVQCGDEKGRIARLVAGLVQDGQTIVLDGGSTAAAVARELSGRSLHVITNSLPIAAMFEDARNIELTLTGGYLYPRLQVMLGPFCEQMLAAVTADVLIMGTGSITENGFSNNNTLVVGSERKMIEIASRVIIVADYTKFGRAAMIPLAPLEVADIVVSDAKLSVDYQEMLRRHDVKVLLA